MILSVVYLVVRCLLGCQMVLARRPGRCTGKAVRREYLGYAGRRVLVSRKWSGKTLADRRNWLLATLGLSATVDSERIRRNLYWAA